MSSSEVEKMEKKLSGKVLASLYHATVRRNLTLPPCHDNVTQPE